MGVEMRNLVRWIGRNLGFTTWYHVSATYPLEGGGYAVLSCTCSIRPWLHHDNYGDLVDYVQTLGTRKDVRPSVLGITRLGV